MNIKIEKLKKVVNTKLDKLFADAKDKVHVKAATKVGVYIFILTTVVVCSVLNISPRINKPGEFIPGFTIDKIHLQFIVATVFYVNFTHASVIILSAIFDSSFLCRDSIKKSSVRKYRVSKSTISALCVCILLISVMSRTYINILCFISGIPKLC